MSKRPELQVGQTVYIESIGWLNSEVREPRPHEVTRVNTKSIYTKPVGGSHETRFDKKTWSSTTSIGGKDYIWLSREDYWNMVKRNEDKKVLRSRIAGELSNLSLEKLQEVAAMLDIQLK